MIRTRITNPRFETWVVTQADSSPIRLRFETWVVTQADSSPIRLRFETWVVTQADSYSNHKSTFQDVGGHPGRLAPN